ncbi:hypothetical protein [Spirochaeta africana]|uniref:Uncharacterized protein n=1 Tax=Spirochaeta africana (strain ATCC 700263 / DSM 8902 / Z-7692) TaxID=889378 RepID=H9UKI9_SPIAZ|nr:hypothetical protein [Spirochaeta africana]AFG38032.1 hypothetical protein Spiaf_1981 [Spirochaeta africana DSM 8902]
MGRKKLSVPKHETVNGYLVRLEDLSFDQAEAVMDFKRRNPRLGYGEIALLLGYADRILTDGTGEVVTDTDSDI